MRYRDKYNLCKQWYEKVSVMSIFHCAMCSREKTWTINDTAKYFECSKALVSENLKLAIALHKNPELQKSVSRKSALIKLKVL